MTEAINIIVDVFAVLTGVASVFAIWASVSLVLAVRWRDKNK